MNDFIIYLNNIVSLNQNQINHVQSKLSETTLKSGETFLELSDKNDKIAFIQQGLLEMTIYDDGEDKTIDFLFPNEFAVDYLNFLLDKPSEIEIRALKPSKLICIRKKDLHRLYEKDIQFQKIGRILAEKYYIDFVQRLRNGTLSAKERFNLLFKEKPYWFNEIPQYKIAAYLNISPEWLSKLRAK